MYGNNRNLLIFKQLAELNVQPQLTGESSLRFRAFGYVIFQEVDSIAMILVWTDGPMGKSNRMLIFFCITK